jgi:hypothetical protein
LDTFFANNSEVWSLLFHLRRCIPLSTLSSASSFHSYESILDSFLSLVERVGLLLEPPPPPPVKSEEEIEAEALAEAAALKRAATKEKKRRAAAIAAGLDPDEEPEPPSASKKKKKLLSGSALPDPPVHEPSALSFGLNTLDVLHELFDSFRVRLTGFKKTAELDWNSEAKVADLVKCCELWYKIQAFLFRYGSWSGLIPAEGAHGGEPKRMSSEEIKPFFLKETGDPHALWFQKQLVSAVKKTKDLLADNSELANKLQQHSEYWIKQYPVEKKAESNKKKVSAH